MKVYAILALAIALVALGCTSAPAGANKSDTAAPKAGKALYSFGFEDGTTGDWKPKGPPKIMVSDKFAHTGKLSLFTTGRADTWNAPEMDITEMTKSGEEFNVSCWVLIPEGGSAVMTKMTVETMAGGAKNWVQIAKPTECAPGKWTQVAGVFPSKKGLDYARLYIEPLDPMADFYADDIEISGQ